MTIPASHPSPSKPSQSQHVCIGCRLGALAHITQVLLESRLILYFTGSQIDTHVVESGRSDYEGHFGCTRRNIRPAHERFPEPRLPLADDVADAAVLIRAKALSQEEEVVDVWWFW